MTEQEWLECADLMEMLHFLDGKVSDRKLWLFASACCHRIWHLLPDHRCREALQVLDRYADGACSAMEALKIGMGVLDALKEYSNGLIDESVQYLHVGPGDPETPPDTVAINAAYAVRYVLGDVASKWCKLDTYTSFSSLHLSTTASYAAHAVRLATGQPENEEREGAAQQAILRCIAGPPPFQSTTFKPAWRSGIVTSLAEGIYTASAFDRLGILADALEEIGCTDAAILDHCRTPSEHARGCFVVDLLLGKE